jgi:hypothetical protein
VPYYVSPEVCNALEAAHAAIPDYELRREDLLTPFGWAYFSRPLPVDNSVDFEDIEKSTAGSIAEADWLGAMVGMSWAPLVLRAPDGQLANEPINGESAGEITSDLAKANSIIVHFYRESTERRSGMPIASLTWVFGQGMMNLYEVGHNDYQHDNLPALSATTLQELKYFAALIAFMGQEIFPTRREKLPRDARKRLTRAGFDPGSEQNEPRIIYLRRVTHRPEDAADGTGVEYTHRWWVKGHWRNQWYPTENRHKPLWIHPHIKGPDGLPIAAKRDELVAVVR